MRKDKQLFLIALAFCCLNGLLRSTYAKTRGETVSPRLAKVLGLVIGQSTMGELERRFGPGKIITGGHPQSARLWRSKQTGWGVRADGFEFGKDGTYLLEEITINRDLPTDWKNGIPEIDLSRNRFVLLQSVKLGDSKLRVTQALKDANIRIRTIKSDSVVAEESTSLHSVHNVWCANFEFKSNRLNAISLYRE